MAAVGAGIEAGKNSSAVNPQENSVRGSRQGVGGRAQVRRDAAYAKRAADCAAAEQSVPWWLWWNILSMDAPMVAVTWAAVFAGAAGERLAGADAAVLFLVVWAIYVCDRLLDGWNARDRGGLRARHFFCERHGTVLVMLVAFAGGIIFWLAREYLPAAERGAGWGLGAVLAVYLVAIHFVGLRISWMLPKEMVVGAVFASGVALPVWSRSAELTLASCVPWVFFGLLCTLNCWCIECWEKCSGGDNSHGHEHLRALASAQVNRFALGLAFLAVVGGVAQRSRGVLAYELMAIGSGALLLLALNMRRGRFSAAALRVLADAALLAPALAVVVLRGVAA